VIANLLSYAIRRRGGQQQSLVGCTNWRNSAVVTFFVMPEIFV